MIKIKLCGLSREIDIETANTLRPDYIGFVFAKKSLRYVSQERAAQLKEMLDPGILAVGVFVNEDPDRIADLLDSGIIDVAQLHGSEDEEYIKRLRSMTGKPLIKAFTLKTPKDVEIASQSSADLLLLDSGTGGTGSVFDWDIAKGIRRPYLLAGGLDPENVAEAIKKLHPYGVDVSSGIETGGLKDQDKMNRFVDAVRSVL